MAPMRDRCAVRFRISPALTVSRKALPERGSVVVPAIGT